MKKQKVSLVLMTLLLLASLLACKLPWQPTPIPSDEPTITIPLPPTETEEPEEPEITPTEAPTEPAATLGQIVYRRGGNLWRYLISSGEIIQVTTDGYVGDYENQYNGAAFSPDGTYLAVSKYHFDAADELRIYDLGAGSSQDLSAYGAFINWSGTGLNFYTALGEMICPAVEDLSDQDLLNFDVVRNDLADLSSPTVLANIGGGLKIVHTVSPDGQWLVVSPCGCYSECGNSNLINLLTNTVASPPSGVRPGPISFAPDSAHLTTSEFQIYGYYAEPLYVANINFTGASPIYSAADTAIDDQTWSPDGNRIAFTGIRFNPVDYTVLDTQVRVINPDGSNRILVEAGEARFLKWSPLGEYLLFSQGSGTAQTLWIYALASGEKTLLPISMDEYSTGALDWGRLP